ncbi:MAG: EamA family transporter [Zavarzinella sp.]
MSHVSTQTRAGIFYGLGAYAAWGVVPLYFYSVRQCPPKELLAHRILWSAVFLAIIITIFGRWHELFRILRSRLALWLALSAVLVSANWYVYVYSAMTGQVTQASLGYFILPLVNAAGGCHRIP